MAKYTVSQVARAAGVSQSSVRIWSSDYSEYLSPGATPEKGIQRFFNEDDLNVFLTVKAMRDNLATGEQIITALNKGERYVPDAPGNPPDAPGNAQEQPAAIVPMELLERFTLPYREQLQAHEARIERLEGELQAERAARLQAEINAARLEGRLQEGNKKPFYFFDWLLGK